MLAEQLVCPLHVGRDAPLTAGFHALDRVQGGHGNTLLVSGEAGIGKTRFVRAMVERARTLGFVTLQGACFEADRAHPYAPILDLVRVLSATASPALAAHYFAPAATEFVTLLPELRSVFPDVEPRESGDPEEERRRLFHSFTEAIQALGRTQPVLLVIEDVHWSDDATLDLMLHVARRISTDAVVLALTFRSDEVGPRLTRLLADFDRARCASEVGLRPLAEPEVELMLQAIFGKRHAFGAAFGEALHGITEGNPFFIEETLKALLVEGDLTQADGTWRARPLENVRIPRTATEAVDRRLESLTPEAKRVASIAAVAGRRFDFDLLQAVTGQDEAELLARIRELVTAQLVVEETADRFAFRHALTREAMRARLLVRERVALHRAIAAVLEKEPGADDDARAYHAFEAGSWDDARRYGILAGNRAMALSAPREALRHFDRAIMSTHNAGHEADASLLISRGRAHEILGAFHQSNDDFAAALVAAREGGDRLAEWQALHALGMLWSARDYERAGAYRREALAFARTIGDTSIVARSLNRVGNWFVNREDPLAGIPYHAEALAIFESAGDARGVSETVDLLAMSHHIAGAQHNAVPLYDRAISLFTALEDRRGLANALAVIVACGPGHHAASTPVAESVLTPELIATERALTLSGDIGWRAGEAFARYILADALSWRGNMARALLQARESLAIAQEMDHFEWQCGARRSLGFIALELNAVSEAVSHLSAAHDVARRLGSRTWIRWTGAPFATALARHGDVLRASDVLDDVDRVVPPSAGGREQRTLGERHLAVARAEVALASRDFEGVLTQLH